MPLYMFCNFLLLSHIGAICFWMEATGMGRKSYLSFWLNKLNPGNTAGACLGPWPSSGTTHPNLWSSELENSNSVFNLTCWALEDDSVLREEVRSARQKEKRARVRSCVCLVEKLGEFQENPLQLSRRPHHYHCACVEYMHGCTHWA